MSYQSHDRPEAVQEQNSSSQAEKVLLGCTRDCSTRRALDSLCPNCYIICAELLPLQRKQLTSARTLFHDDFERQAGKQVVSFESRLARLKSQSVHFFRLGRQLASILRLLNNRPSQV